MSHIGQRHQIPLKQRSQEVVSPLIWVLRVEHTSSESAIHAFQHPDTYSASNQLKKIILFEPGVIEHAHNSSTGEVEAAGDHKCKAQVRTLQNVFHAAVGEGAVRQSAILNIEECICVHTEQPKGQS